MVILRTIGKIKSNTGKEIPQAESHVYSEKFSKPMLLNVLIHETINVMIIDSNKGKTIAA